MALRIILTLGQPGVKSRLRQRDTIEGQLRAERGRAAKYIDTAPAVRDFGDGFVAVLQPVSLVASGRARSRSAWWRGSPSSMPCLPAPCQMPIALECLLAMA